MDVLTVGEALIDWVCPERGAKLSTGTVFHPSAGGAPANVAVGLSRLGVKTGYAGRVAMDPWGEQLLGLLDAEGVDTQGVVRDPEADTRMAYVLLDENGDRVLAHFSKHAADARFAETEIDRLPLEGVKIVYLTSMMQAHPTSAQAFSRMVERAKIERALLVYDPNYRPVLWAESAAARKALESAARAADLLKLGTEELAFLTGTHDLREGMALAWERFEPALLVVTDGPMGSFWKNSASEGHLQAIPIPVLDTTGAGDGFVAGLLAGIVEEDSDPEVIRWLPGETMAPLLRRANGVGALVATRMGAMTALPRRDELDAWLKGCD